MIRIRAKHPSGFDVMLDAPSLEAADTLIKQLLDMGYKPIASANGATEFPRLPDGTFLCPKHGMPLRKREKQGDSWLSHALQRGDQTLYCRGHAYGPRESDGYFVDL